MASRAYIAKDSGRVYEFGSFRLDEAERVLFRDGEPVALTPKVFDTLLLLVQNAGHLVDKDELMKSIWPDSFVEEVNLNRSISTLRRALGEAPNEPHYIETVPKRGYRFIAPVKADRLKPDLAPRDAVSLQIVPDEESPSPDVTETAATVARRFSRHRFLALATLITLAIGVLAYFSLTHRSAGGDNAAKTEAVGALAVLPFRVLGGAEQEQYLEIGMTDVLITTLSNIKAINVRPTSAVLKYSKTDQTPVEIGRALRVDAVLEGSVQKVDDRIRVTVRLLDVNKDASLWAGKFDEPAADILKVQDSIAERVTAALASNLRRSGNEAFVKHFTDNSDAYQFYLKGRFFWNKRTTGGYKTAIGYYERAIDKDPNYALAYAGLADAYSLIGNSSLDEERGDHYEKAKSAAVKALEIDEGLAEAHTSLGWIRRVHDWDWVGSESEFRRAIELNPNSAHAHQWYALLLTTLGRSPEAIAEIKRAQELDPLSWVIHANAFAVYFFARQFDQTIAECQQGLEMDSTNAILGRNLTTVLVQKGMYDEAITQIRRFMPTEGSTTLAALLARAYIRNGQQENATDAITYLQNRPKTDSEALFYLATVYADSGEKDKAFEYLRKAFEVRDDRLIWMKLDPRLDSLRSDPRFEELLRKMNLS